MIFSDFSSSPGQKESTQKKTRSLIFVLRRLRGVDFSVFWTGQNKRGGIKLAPLEQKNNTQIIQEKEEGFSIFFDGIGGRSAAFFQSDKWNATFDFL